VSVRGLLCDMSEATVCLPFSEGARSSSCSMSFGGSKSRCQQMVQVSIYSEMEGNFEHKSAIGTWLKIGN